MSTDEQPYPPDRLIFMARTHQKVIDYYNYVLEELTPSDEERSRIVGYIFREERPWRRSKKSGLNDGSETE